MVYATYGRTGIYQLQHLLRTMNYQDYSMNAELINTKIVLNILLKATGFTILELMTIKLWETLEFMIFYFIKGMCRFQYLVYMYGWN